MKMCCDKPGLLNFDKYSVTPGSDLIPDFFV